MTNSNRNFVFAYVLLVALPLFGLAGVLRRGRKLSAPMSIGGVWKISAGQDQLNGFPCGKSLLGPNATFAILQSGKAFTLNTPNVPFFGTSGTVDGNKIIATLIPSAVASKDAGCGEQPVSLTASVDTKASPRTLQGSLRVENCPGCAAIEIRAIRDEQARAKETH